MPWRDCKAISPADPCRLSIPSCGNEQSKMPRPFKQSPRKLAQGLVDVNVWQNGSCEYTIRKMFVGALAGADEFSARPDAAEARALGIHCAIGPQGRVPAPQSEPRGSDWLESTLSELKVTGAILFGTRFARCGCVTNQTTVEYRRDHVTANR